MSDKDKSNCFGTLPIVLLSASKSALIVGGGKVAVRKMENLLAGGMIVTVIAPDLTADILTRAAEKRITIRQKEVEENDLTGMSLVIAATDDKKVNRQVLHWAAERKILSSSSDGNWTEGDFISPAVYRDQEVTFSVSTNGKACRKSRLIRNIIARHLKSVETADLYCLGTDFRHLSTERRGELQLNGQKAVELGMMIKEIWGVHEFILLNTCNRIEIWALAAQNLLFEPLLKRLLKFDGLEGNEFYQYVGEEVFNHAAELTAGLKSQLYGESHIVAQVKEALELAATHGWSGGTLHEIVYDALHISKELRQKAVSISHIPLESLALDLSLSKLNVKPEKIVIIGTGMLGSRFFNLCRRNFPDALIYYVWNKNKPEVLVQDSLYVHLVKLPDLAEVVTEADIIFAAVSSEKAVLKADDFDDQYPAKKIICLDCSVPAALDPDLKELAGIELYVLDEINSWCIKHNEHQNSSEHVNKIILKHRELYDKIINGFKSGNKIQPSGSYSDS